LSELQKSIVDAINYELDAFRIRKVLISANFEKIIIVGNTTMLHILLGEYPISIALVPFKPEFTDKQVRKVIQQD
jgi:RACo middle region